MTRLVALVLSTLALWACDPCPGPQDLIFLVRDPDPETQQLIDQCLGSPPNCMPLCEAVSGVGRAIIVHCEIHAQSDPAFIQVHVGVDPAGCTTSR